MHDLRRTFSTIGGNNGVTEGNMKALTNHKNSADVHQAYFVADLEQLRAPMDQIANKMLEQFGVKATARRAAPSKVVSLRKRAKSR